MSDQFTERIGRGKTGDFVDLSGLESHQIDRFLFLARARSLPYRSGPSGVEFALGHRAAIEDILDEALAFVPEDIAGQESLDELATFGRRALGYLLDAIAVTVVAAFATVGVLAVAGLSLTAATAEDPKPMEGAIVVIASVVASFLLICVATFRKGRSFGKWATITLVIDFDTAGEISFRQSLVRWIVPLAPGLVTAAAASQVSSPSVWVDSLGNRDHRACSHLRSCLVRRLRQGHPRPTRWHDRRS